MANVTYTDKSQTTPYDPSKFNAQDANEIKTSVNSKQDAQAGKGLSTNDYTNAEKTKLTGIATGATANDTDANLKNRANHTGTQAISTVTGLQTALDGKENLRIIPKTGHGFGIGWLVYQDSGGIWQRCNADANDAEAVGDVIVSVPDANTFVLGLPGTYFTTTGLTPGPYYLDTTTTFTANYTTTIPQTPGQVQREIFRAISATVAQVMNTEYFEVTDPQTPTVGDGSITNTKLATDIKVGSLAALNTSTKSSVVAAVNELVTSISGLSGGGSSADRDYGSLPALSTPGSFTATAASDTQINLTWSDVSDEVNYVIQRGTTNLSYSTIASPAAGSTSYNDTGRNAGTQYFYRMKAVGDAANYRDSIFAFATATTTGGGGGATVEQEIFLNFTNQYRDPNVYSGVQGIRDTGGTAVAAGTAGMNAVKDIANVVTTVNFALTSAGIGTGNTAPYGGDDPSNTTIFGKSQVAADYWGLNNNGTARLSGLTASRTYKLFFWFLSNGWEHNNVTVTANSVTTSTVDSAGNFGDNTGSPLADAALREIDVVSDGSGIIDITFHLSSGSLVPLTALYIQRMSS